MTNRYYVSGNTAEGFLNFIDSNIRGIKRTIVLKHDSDSVKTSVLKHIIKKYEATNNLDILLSPLGSEYLDGVILRQESMAVVIDQIAPTSVNSEVIELEEHFPSDVGAQLQEKKHIQSATQMSYENFATGLSIHDKLEQIYIDYMDFKRADELAVNLIRDILPSQTQHDKEGEICQRLFGTNTPEGAVNVVPEIIQKISNVCYIKGRAGTGKSTFMKKVVNAATTIGLDVEQYRCSFDPRGIDMVIVRELDFCIFDSTDPHEFFPNRESDNVIDLYEKAVTPGTDEKFSKEITELTNRYKSYMKKGIKDLQKADSYRDQAEKMYTLPSKKQLNTLVETWYL
ncbi:hypothetical protein WMZ97_04595 [Lentibacillus sp. N15]|uniref:hypothetical protein n=1 Tax=Lentibacillus songyuanensis TaxID=3136161 RepID=UPI0031BB1055